MAKPLPSPFTRGEYELRLARVRGEMERRGVDSLIVSSEAEIAYLTGYAGLSAYVPQVLYLDQVKEPVLFLRDMDASAALHSTWLPDEAIVAYPESWIGDRSVSPYDYILRRLATLASAGDRVGIALGDLPVSVIDRARARLPDRELIDADDLVSWVRLVKSPQEILVMREAGGIASAAMKTAVEAIRPGVRECDAAAEICAALARGTAACGGHDVLQPLMPSGSRTGSAHLTWTDEPYQSGDWVNLELGGVRYRYAAAIMRTFCLGSPPERLVRLRGAAVEGLHAVLGAIRPGAICEDAAAAFQAVMKKHGFEKKSRCGYPIGINWLEPTASLQQNDRTVLEENMTFHLMLGMWPDRDFGHVHSETVRVTRDGCELLTNGPAALRIDV